jgi:hypothetical protein
MSEAEILENNALSYLRIIGIFLVVGIGVFNFTDSGKSFSLISLIISLILSIVVTVDYFKERQRISALGITPRKVVDILMFTMIGVILFICWIIYEVWRTEQTSLSKLVKEIEQKIDETNATNLAILKAGISSVKGDTKPITEIAANISSQNVISEISSILKEIQGVENRRGIINAALLASVS